MEKWKILIVDDEAYQRDILRVIMENEGFAVECAENGERAIEMCHRFSPDVVLCDYKLPDMEGTQVMERLVTSDRHKHEFIIFTAHGTIESAVKAIKRGAFDYLTKPVEREKLILTTNRACERLALVRENIQLKKQLARPFAIEGVIGKHPSILKVLDFIKTVGPLNVTVLITGETGTGKDLIARAIHSASPRKNKIFQAVNCASMPESLLESELFGYEKGAFTGAYSQKQGLIESSNGGTLFLDEVGELPVGPQAKLLRFLEEKKVRRVGGKEEIAIDVRLIAATNKKLSDEIKKGNFREDLFYRFRGFVIELPPLRERSSDLYLLAESFIEKYNLVFNRAVRGIGNEALRVLMDYPWPGNVRQLDSVIEKAVLLARGDIIELADLDLPAQPSSPAGPAFNFEIPPNGVSLEEIERQVIFKAMEKSGGCIARAAKLLGTTYRTVEYRVKKYAIPRAR
ncbi:MAG: sigma-54 dependent transcriptional regulator [Pseudomonadota bacterium]